MKEKINGNSISKIKVYEQNENLTDFIQDEIKSGEIQIKKAIATARVYYREQPDKNSKYLGIIEKNMIVIIEDENEDWYKLKELGWSMKKFYEEQA